MPSGCVHSLLLMECGISRRTDQLMAQILDVKAALEKERGEALPAANLVLISQGKVSWQCNLPDAAELVHWHQHCIKSWTVL